MGTNNEKDDKSKQDEKPKKEPEKPIKPHDILVPFSEEDLKEKK